jgi:NTE family protein
MAPLRLRGLALAAGGCRGAYQAGAILRICGDLGMTFDMVGGISAGAITSAYMAQYQRHEWMRASRKLYHAWTRLERPSVYQRWPLLGTLWAPWRAGLYSTKPLQRWVQRNIDPKKIRLGDVDLWIGAVNLEQGKYQEYEGTHPEIRSVVLASSAFPGVFPPRKIDGMWHTDGAVMEVTPIQTLIRRGCEDIVAIVPYPDRPSRDPRKKWRSFEVARRALDLMMQEIIDNDLQWAAAFPQIKLTIIRPRVDLGVESFAFDRRTLQLLADYGYADASMAVHLGGSVPPPAGGIAHTALAATSITE